VVSQGRYVQNNSSGAVEVRERRASLASRFFKKRSGTADQEFYFSLVCALRKRRETWKEGALNERKNSQEHNEKGQIFKNVAGGELTVIQRRAVREGRIHLGREERKRGGSKPQLVLSRVPLVDSEERKLKKTLVGEFGEEKNRLSSLSWHMLEGVLPLSRRQKEWSKRSRIRRLLRNHGGIPRKR